MSASTLHLSPEDFDAYLPERATSNAFSRPRIEVKQRAMAWAKDVATRLAAEGMPTDVHASDEHPTLRNKKRVDCQWVVFWRDEAAREDLERLLDQDRPLAEAIDDPNPHTRHAFLALRIDAKALEISFVLHPDAKVDVDNLRARLAPNGGEVSPSAPLVEELTLSLHKLPEQFSIGVGGEERVPCEAVTADAIVAMLARAAEGKVPLWIGWTIPREVALEHAATVGEQLDDAIVVLAPIYLLVAWSRDNDHIALDRRLEGVEEQRARTHAELSAENDKWRAEREAEASRRRELSLRRAEEQRAARREAPRPTLASLFKPRSEPADKASRTSRPAPVATPPSAAPVEAEQRAIPRVSSAPQTIEKGARVCVMSGAFANRVGTVAELDGRGGARVLLGLLSTRVDLADLELPHDPRERPALQSSHRAPAAAPRKAR